MKIYRIFECSAAGLVQIAFVSSLEAVQDFITSCYKCTTADNVFYFSQEIYVEN